MASHGGVYLVARQAVAAALVVAATLLPALAEPHAPAVVPGAPDALAVPDAKPQMRNLRLKHHWTGESLDVVYRIGDAYQPDAMAAISHFMRDWRCSKSATIDPKLLDRIHALHQEIGTHRTIKLVSGYRSEGYNASLLRSGRTVDPHSEHMYGRAVDIFVPGVRADKLREAAQGQALGGVGYYPFSGPRFVHLDTGPSRHWTELDPAAIRRLGFARRPRTAFKLDCNLTMAEVLREISPIQAIAALPPGAAVNPAASFHMAAFSQAAAPDEQSPAGIDDEDRPPAMSAPAVAVCEGGDPLAPLGLIAELHAPKSED